MDVVEIRGIVGIVGGLGGFSREGQGRGLDDGVVGAFDETAIGHALVENWGVGRAGDGWFVVIETKVRERRSRYF